MPLREVGDQAHLRPAPAVLPRCTNTHAKARGEWRGACIQIEAGAFTEFPITGRTFETRFARTGIDHQQHAVFGRQALCAGLDRGGFFGAREAGKKVQHRQFAAWISLRLEDTEPRAAGSAGFVSIETLHAAVAALFTDDLETHANFRSIF